MDEQGLIVPSLDLSFVVVCIFDGNHMSVFLVFTSYIAFIDPLTIVLAQSIKIDPNCSLPVCSNSLWPLHVDRYLIIIILEIYKSSGWVTVSIKVVILLFAEKCLIILMFEHLPIHSQPSIGISHKLVVIIDRRDDLEIKVLKMVSLSRCDCLNLPLIGSRVRNAD